VTNESKSIAQIIFIGNQGCNQLFHSMTSSSLFNRGTTFSQTVTYNQGYHTVLILQCYVLENSTVLISKKYPYL